ncbi:hypothetical protein DSO57_1030150 [Entomophthora muscae]|uniref:Uncharacterized protein n=1 Tax=Entomophthora muscae TaxID=34485 RepID=A0ACC2RS16_9FUNG|nr:hypothetical protein DSO57_1030150 [Entomophthora muscae]
MSATTGELPLIPSASSYDYSKLGFAYLTMLGLTEQVIPHMGVWRLWATAANYVIQIALIIYWAFQAQPFPSNKGSPGSHPGHEKPNLLLLTSYFDTERNFVVYTLAPALVLIWCTTPDLWGCISHSIHHVGAYPDNFMHLLENIPSCTQDIFATSENVVRSLTCDNLEPSAID